MTSTKGVPSPMEIVWIYIVEYNEFMVLGKLSKHLSLLWGKTALGESRWHKF